MNILLEYKLGECCVQCIQLEIRASGSKSFQQFRDLLDQLNIPKISEIRNHT